MHDVNSWLGQRLTVYTDNELWQVRGHTEINKLLWRVSAVWLCVPRCLLESATKNRDVLIYWKTKDSWTKSSSDNSTFLTDLIQLTWYKLHSLFSLDHFDWKRESTAVLRGDVLCWQGCFYSASSQPPQLSLSEKSFSSFLLLILYHVFPLSSLIVLTKLLMTNFVLRHQSAQDPIVCYQDNTACGLWRSRKVVNKTNILTQMSCMGLCQFCNVTWPN